MHQFPRHPSFTFPAMLLLLMATLPAVASTRVPSPDPGGGTGGPFTITLLPGANQLTSALEAAGAGGTVILKPGRHSESGGLVIGRPVTLRGEAGAVLDIATTPTTTYPLYVDAALRVRGTVDVTIEGITLTAPGEGGNSAILVEDAAGVDIRSNTILAHQFGIIVQRGSDVRVSDNSIIAHPGLILGTLPEGHGIVVVNGGGALLERNTIADATFGIWGSDHDGLAAGNVVIGSLGGINLSRVPDGHFLISGSDLGSQAPASDWTVRANLASGNSWGYLVTDGANGNELVDNIGSSNSAYDVELTCDTDRFGFPQETSFRNRVTTHGEKNLVVKDCGGDNRVTGAASRVNIRIDPCS